MRNTKIDAKMSAQRKEIQEEMELDMDQQKVDNIKHKFQLLPEEVTPEMQEGIETQKQENKFVFQMISKENGKRSEPFISNWDALYETFRQHKDDLEMDDYILLVAVLDGSETVIPGTPLITIQFFMDFHNGA